MTNESAATLEMKPATLAFFIDDTGHEEFADKNHPVFGLGGCAVTGANYAALVRQPWNHVRALCTNDPQTPLHAAKFSRNATPDHIRAVESFFRGFPFIRLAAINHHRTKQADGLAPIKLICDTLRERIREVSTWQPFNEVAIVFESSDRLNRQIEECFHLEEFIVDGETLPVTCYFMSKSSGETGLEVADFIMHAVGRQTKQNLKQRGVFVPDFCAVFHSQDTRLCSFIEVESVVEN